MRSIVQLSLSSRSPPRTFRTHGRTPPPSSIDGGPTPRWWNMLKMVSIKPHYLTSKIYILRDIKLKITLLIFICIFHYYIGIFITNFHFYFSIILLHSNQTKFLLLVVSLVEQDPRLFPLLLLARSLLHAPEEPYGVCHFGTQVQVQRSTHGTDEQ